MTFRVTLSPGARQDLSELRRYIRKASSSAIASRFIRDILVYSQGLQTFPHRGTPRGEQGRPLRVIGFRGRVSILFSVSDSEVTILAYTYAGRNWSDDYAE